MKKHFLEIIVFVGGMAVMVFELVGARVLAPYMGTSILVWSSLIGIILASLSAGYFWGGKIADRHPDYNTFSKILFWSAVFTALTAFIKFPILNFLDKHVPDIRFESVLASIVLFGPGSFLLAAISPYAARLKINDLKQSGSTVGSLYAISTLGSIVGTFLTGFVLVLYLANTKIIFLISLAMLVCSVVARSYKLFKSKIAAAIVILIALIFGNSYDNLYFPKYVIRIASQYSNFTIKPGVDQLTSRPILILTTDYNETQSAQFIDNKDNELVFTYAKLFRLAKHFNPGINKALMFGGAAYSFPKDFLKSYPQSATMDVVEIDPKMTAAAKKYFGLPDDPRLTTYNEDGRTFLNKNVKKYDAIFVDAFKSATVPFQLSTVEAVQKMSDSLNDNGVVMTNIIDSINGNTSNFISAEYATYAKVFPNVLLFRAQSPETDIVQNLILVGLKSKTVPPATDSNTVLANYLKRIWTQPLKQMPVLTDDYAPVERYMMPVIIDIARTNM